MRAVRCAHDGIRVVDVDRPQTGGVRVRVTSAGICGSDLGRVAAGPSPITLGHEFAGLLDDDTPVAVEAFGRCGACDQCAGRNYNRCRNAHATSFGFGIDGGMCDEIMVDPRALTFLPLGVPPRDGALVEPIAGALHAMARANLQCSDTVLVVGGGSLGLIDVCIARSFGCEVSLLARHEHQMTAGRTLGATSRASTTSSLMQQGQ